MKTTWLEASAGSGKTTFLISQIEHAKPEEIMFITFSNAAAQELKNRIQNDDIKIMTLHSLAYKILLEQIENIELTEETNELKQRAILSMLNNKEFVDLTKWLMQENIFELSEKKLNEIIPPNLLNKATPPEQINFEFEILLANNELIDNEIFYSIKLIFFTKQNERRKKIKLEASEEYIEWAIKRIYEHENYKNHYANWANYKINNWIYEKETELKEKNNLVYYADLIDNAIKLLKHDEHANLLFKYFGNIKLFLIDEAQDLSETQWNLLLVILEEWAALNGKLIVASDPKQLIYEFQGANIETFKQSKETLKKISNHFEIKELNHTYRLPKEVCEFLNKIGSNLNIDFQAHSTQRELQGEVKLLEIEKTEDIANYIKTNQLTNAMILFKQNTPRIEQLASAILANGLLINSPYSIKHPVIKDFQHLIKFLHTKSKLSLGILFRVFNKPELTFHQMTQEKEYHFLMQLKQYKNNLEQLFLIWISHQAVQKFLTHKLDQAKNFWQEILAQYAIFYKHDAMNAIADNKNFYKNYILNLEQNPFQHGIFFNTVHASKGMEANHIFLLETDFKSKFKNDTDRLLYVALTRTKNQLIIPILNSNIGKLENTWADKIINNTNLAQIINK